MKTYRFSLQPLSAFGTELVGDTLFGQLCWVIAYRFGEARLKELLSGYLEQRPFMVVSDAFLAENLPLPILPSLLWDKIDGAERKRKQLKRLVLIDKSNYQEPLNYWQSLAYDQKEKKMQGVNSFIKKKYLQFHNTIDRSIQKTGGEGFAPFATTQILYPENTYFDVYIVLDESRFALSELTQVLQDVGDFGFGRDASTGMGKFKVKSSEEVYFKNDAANTYLTLANCAPQNLELDKARSFYTLTSRFGRHGGQAALSNPFKKPIILAKTAAIFTPQHWQECLFLGNGLSNISYGQKDAVHQGYAPVIGVQMDFSRLQRGSYE